MGKRLTAYIKKETATYVKKKTKPTKKKKAYKKRDCRKETNS
jgi:hypothetical protein